MRASARGTGISPSRGRSARAALPAGPFRARPAHGSRARRGNSLSCQPALATPVMLGFPEALAPAAGDAEVELLHVLVIGEALRASLEHHAAILEDVAEVGEAQRDHGVLLGRQEAHLLRGVEALHDLEDLLDDLWGEAHRGLVEED